MKKRGLAVAAAVATLLIPAAASSRDPQLPRVNLLKDFEVSHSVRIDSHGPIRPNASPRQLRREGLGRPIRVADAAPMPAPIVSVEGISNSSGVTPPDVNGDVGPNHYVQIANHFQGSEFSVFEKDGDPVAGPISLESLWGRNGGVCGRHGHGDPIVQYDQLAGRWLLTQFAFKSDSDPPFMQCVAISETSDPMSAQKLYSFRISDTFFPDFPKFAVWPDAYYMSIHLFGEEGYEGQGMIAFDRESMLLGEKARQFVSFFEPSLFGVLPSDLQGPTPPPPGAPNYLVVVQDDNLGRPEDRILLYEFHLNWEAPRQSEITGPAIIEIEPINSKLCRGSFFCIPQKGTSMKLDALAGDPLIKGLFLNYPQSYRRVGTSESLLLTHTVKVPKKNHAAVEWYEIKDPGGTATLAQQGTQAPNGLRRWLASIAMDKVGNIALGYSTSSRTTFPSVAYAGRLVTDPPGQLTQGEDFLVRGGGSQTASPRWGDYNSLMVDPSDDCTFWYTNEFYPRTSGAGWNTIIASFKYPTCT